jgi:hypothetical protein
MGVDLVPFLRDETTRGGRADVMLRLTLERLADELDAVVHGAPNYDRTGRRELDQDETRERIERALQLAYATLDYVPPID